METNNTLTVSINSDRITVSPKYRLEKGSYSYMKHLGFKYSPSREGFVFNVNEEGARRVEILQNLTPEKLLEKAVFYFGNESDRQDAADELGNAVIEWASEEDKARIEALNAFRKAKAEAENAAKEAKKAQEGENRKKKALAIIAKLKTLANGYGADMFNLSNSNYNMSDLLARSGVRADETVKELCERFGLEAYEGAELDVLEFSISYRNVWASRWDSKPSARRLCLECNHFEKREGTTFICGGSGHFALEMAIHEDEPKIDFKKVVTLSKVAGDDFKKQALQDYLAYRRGELKADSGINSIGMVTAATVTDRMLTEKMRQAFDQANA